MTSAFLICEASFQRCTISVNKARSGGVWLQSGRDSSGCSQGHRRTATSLYIWKELDWEEAHLPCYPVVSVLHGGPCHYLRRTKGNYGFVVSPWPMANPVNIS